MLDLWILERENGGFECDSLLCSLSFCILYRVGDGVGKEGMVTISPWILLYIKKEREGGSLNNIRIEITPSSLSLITSYILSLSQVWVSDKLLLVFLEVLDVSKFLGERVQGYTQ